MTLQNKLKLFRKQNGYSQEQAADKIGIARQTLSKWENGQAVPELNGLILLSELYGVTIDRIVKENDECNTALFPKTNIDTDKTTDFLFLAKQNTYASNGRQAKASRTGSVDFSYENGNGYKYYDTYLGGECFAGEEAVWLYDKPVWSMNYAGRVIGENFNSDFLKQALMAVTKDMPYRGPKIYNNGEYFYHCKTDGEFVWFQGYEEIFYINDKIYECYFHGGAIR